PRLGTVKHEIVEHDGQGGIDCGRLGGGLLTAGGRGELNNRRQLRVCPPEKQRLSARFLGSYGKDQRGKPDRAGSVPSSPSMGAGIQVDQYTISWWQAFAAARRRRTASGGA